MTSKEMRGYQETFCISRLDQLTAHNNKSWKRKEIVVKLQQARVHRLITGNFEFSKHPDLVQDVRNQAVQLHKRGAEAMHQHSEFSFCLIQGKHFHECSIKLLSHLWPIQPRKHGGTIQGPGNNFLSLFCFQAR